MKRALRELCVQIAEGEGLLEQPNTRVQRAVAPDHIFCVTGHIENFRIGTNFRNSLRELAAVHARHYDVGEQEVNYSFMGHCNLQRHCAIRRLDHAIALLLQKLPGKIAKVGLILDHEDSFGTRLGGHGL